MLDDCKRRFSIQVGALNLPRELTARLASLKTISLRQAYESSGRSRYKNSHRMDSLVYFGEFLISEDVSRFRSVQSRKRRRAYASHRCRCRLQSKMTPSNGSSIAREVQSEASPMGVRWCPSSARVGTDWIRKDGVQQCIVARCIVDDTEGRGG
jgi:hypothetical protein